MKNLCSGTHRGGFQFLLILDLWGISFHAVVVFGLGKDLLFKSVLGHCELEGQIITTLLFIIFDYINYFGDDIQHKSEQMV